ncbi:rod shape-determining protein MreC [Planctomycetota bacterium]
MVKRRIKSLRGLLFTWLIVVSVIFLFAPASVTNRLQLGFAGFFQRPLSRCRNITLYSNNEKPDANDIGNSDYIRLRNHLANNIQRLRQEHERNEKLSGLRERTVWNGVNFVSADIITAFMNELRNDFTVNRGREDGLVQGQFALGLNSVVGTVSELSSRTARVQLFTDPRSKVPVTIGQSNVMGIMRGIGNCTAKIQGFATKHKIKAGDIVYVSKKPGLLDVSMIAGTVSDSRPNDENPLLLDLTVEPACETRKLSDVTVIINSNKKGGTLEIAKNK